MTQLPNIDGPVAFASLAADPVAAVRVLNHFAARVGFPGTWKRPRRGSALLAIGAHEVLKVMAPHDATLSAVEVACLRRLETVLPIATPRLLDAGQIEGWPYVRMTRLPGLELTEAWPLLGSADHFYLATQLGEALATLHAIEAPREVPYLDWLKWRAQRLARLEETQRGKGCPPQLLEGLYDFVAQQPIETGRSGWLHTEIMREHLLVQETPKGWRLSGLFDFEPSWVAPVDCEFASVGLFFSAADPRLLGEVQRAAGVAIAPERLFAIAMLHRYANLGWYHRRLGGPLNHAALAAAWFGCSGVAYRWTGSARTLSAGQ